MSCREGYSGGNPVMAMRMGRKTRISYCAAQMLSSESNTIAPRHELLTRRWVITSFEGRGADKDVTFHQAPGSAIDRGVFGKPPLVVTAER